MLYLIEQWRSVFVVFVVGQFVLLNDRLISGVLFITYTDWLALDWKDVLCGQCLDFFFGNRMFLIGYWLEDIWLMFYLPTVMLVFYLCCWCVLCMAFVLVFVFFFVCFHRQPSHSNLFQRMNSLSRGSVIKAGLITHTYERCRHKTCSEQSLQPRWYLRAEFGSNACIFFQFFTYIVPTWPF